jgi:hypothetical protein
MPTENKILHWVVTLTILGKVRKTLAILSSLIFQKVINVKKLIVHLCLLQDLKICLNPPSPPKNNSTAYSFYLASKINGPEKPGQSWITHITCMCMEVVVSSDPWHSIPLPSFQQKQGKSWISQALDCVPSLVLKM